MSKISPSRGSQMTPQVEISSPPSPLILPAQDIRPLSLETLVRDYAPYIQRLARTILDDGSTLVQEAEAEAEDAMQDTFLVASRALPDFRGDASVKTWLTTICVNQCRARLRKRKTRQRLQARLQALLSNLQYQISNIPSPEDSALEADSNHRLWAAVDALDEKHRLPVVLRYVHELPVPEIAAALGLPEGTVHSRLHHARARLKEALRNSP